MDYAEMQKVLAALNINVPRLSVLRSMLERISGDPIPNDEALRLCVLRPLTPAISRASWIGIAARASEAVSQSWTRSRSGA